MFKGKRLNEDEIRELLATFLEVRLLNGERSFAESIRLLKRIGISNEDRKTLWQSCHIFQKRGLYYIVHFKELIALDGMETNFSREDLARRNKVAAYLEKRGLIEILKPEMLEATEGTPVGFTVLSAEDARGWTLIPKYSIGVKKKRKPQL